MPEIWDISCRARALSHSPLCQRSVVNPGPLGVVLRQPKPVLQVPIFNQEVLENRAWLSQPHRRNEPRKRGQGYLNLGAFDHSQRRPSAAAVIQALAPAQPVGRQEVAGPTKSQPVLGTALAPLLWRERGPTGERPLNSPRTHLQLTVPPTVVKSFALMRDF